MESSTVLQIINNLSPFTRQLFVQSKDGRPVFYGSGFLVKNANQNFLITAWHVMESWSESNPLFVDCGSGNKIRQLDGTLYTVNSLTKDANKKVDVAIVELGVNASAGADDSLFISNLHFNTESEIYQEGSTYSVSGFPASMNKNAVSRSESIIDSCGYGLIAQGASISACESVGGNSLDHFALNWSRKNAFSLDGQKRTGPKLQGLSGAPIWRIVADKPQVAGMAIEHHERDKKVILGVRFAAFAAAIGI